MFSNVKYKIHAELGNRKKDDCLSFLCHIGARPMGTPFKDHLTFYRGVLCTFVGPVTYY